jgi:hypothetical protein
VIVVFIRRWAFFHVQVLLFSLLTIRPVLGKVLTWMRVPFCRTLSRQALHALCAASPSSGTQPLLITIPAKLFQ